MKINRWVAQSRIKSYNRFDNEHIPLFRMGILLSMLIKKAQHGGSEIGEMVTSFAETISDV